MHDMARLMSGAATGGRSPQSMRRSRLRVAALRVSAVPLILVALHGTPAWAGGFPASEYDVKAAFLYNFALYVEWPKDAAVPESDPFVIGVLGTDPFGHALDALAREKDVAGRSIVVQRFPSLSELRPCHILFVSSDADQSLPAVIEMARVMKTLVVGDSESAALRGAAIGFVLRDNKVHFSANPAAAKRCGLTVSSKLLRLADIVGDGDARP
jgi:hypothetical protein